MDREGVQGEVDAVDAGIDPLTVLQLRHERAQVEESRALEELRAVMSDEEALSEFGIDISQA